ncbi:AAA family ATPase [Geothermobacter hydrogeniphilus]|uniref:Chromosome segregation protein SMC n=1 Tax=Geothermobacter hydrogeniphilus TaxID=1969733 RepID=A0A1X0Y442_9BACT|nr:AAA family ATPase [Geothermobacter hydrogeniphilus]ORJ59857.1 chromosome segregation protein SMC [Geothermobacter hydrogeniphilus]
MIRAEYLRFLQTLNSGTIPAEVRRIANIVLQNLDALIPLSTTRGQRVQKMVALAETAWDSIGTEIQPLPAQITEQAAPIVRLKSLAVGPFRGFARQEVFDLASQLVLIYGPNGTGKSSFCEALEYGLLGNVAEAESKRFRNLRNYLENAHQNTFEEPELIGINSEGQEMPIVANEALYRFCFVEKNRIDSFSRIAAQAPARQTELISTLFGLDAFNEFVRNFTPEIDGKYIDLEGAKAKQLHDKRQTLAGSKEQLKDNKEELEKLADEKRKLAHEYRETITFTQMVTEFNGDEEHPGAIKNLENDLQEQIGAKSNVTAQALQALEESIKTNLSDLTIQQGKLTEASQQISFKQLYEAVSQVQQGSPDHCPACKTPLSQVTVNPYTHAGEELEKLHHIAELQQTAKDLEGKIGQSLLELSQIVNICCARLTQNPLNNSQVAPPAKAGIDWWNSLHRPSQDGSTPWQHLQTQVQQLEENDKEIDQAAQQRATKQTELERLRGFAEKITVLQTRRKTADDAVKKAQQTITDFDTENAQLIAEAEAEKEIVARNQIIAGAYAAFVSRLNEYKNALPAQLVADLGETVVALYNAFNRNDSIKEQLASIHLPLEKNQRLKIAFIADPETFFDALHVLSEGHIRCIGLAILLAKNLKENCPLLIFDDPVNAIDDGHRETIRRSLFDDDFFTGKQIILTCHGEEFFKDIQNLLSAERVSESKPFTFLPRLDEQHIRVDFNCAPRNYIIAAQSHLDKNEIRYALSKSRNALESLTKGKLWSYVRRHGDGNLSLKFRSITSEIELRNLTEQLRSKIAKADFSDPDKSRILTPVETLLGLGGNGSSREWRYLNKGTHEEADRAEFDRHSVSEIVTALAQIDGALG